MKDEYIWAGFTHQELSMIASEIAGGGALCCSHHAAERVTVTASRPRRDRLACFAHDSLGCREAITVTIDGEEARERWAVRSARYLENFLNSI